jgi:ATP-binding protein involved in chromosome partitioning
MPISDAETPTQIQQHDSRTLSIAWADGEESLLDVRALRLACGCAHCVDEWSGEPLLAPESVPEDVAPVGIQSVGRYAIQIDWSDGHSTGIYPFEWLRRLADHGRLRRAPGEVRANPASPPGNRPGSR